MTTTGRAARALCVVVMSVQGALSIFPSLSSAEEARFTKPAFLYTMYCVQCHGVNKNGKGVNTKDMSVQPRDHSDPKGMGDIPNAELFKAIKEGGLAVNKSVLMPAWGGVLTDSEITEMVAYLRHVCQCGGAQENPQKGEAQ